MSDSSREKTVVLGLDGGNMELIRPWIEDGTLPNIRSLCEEGVSTVLKSCSPPVTCPAWKVFSTGCEPGKLGWYWWRQYDKKENRMVPPFNKYSITQKEVWDYMSEDGIRCGVVGFPLTYPPKEINGFFVSGGAMAGENFSRPGWLAEKLEQEINYKSHPETSPKAPPSEEVFKDYESVVKSKMEAGKFIWENFETDTLFLATYYLNGLQHFWWDHNYVKEMWRMLDEYVGYFRENADNIIIVSDHGLAPVHSKFFMGDWMVEKGYTSVKRTDSGLKTEKIYYILEQAADTLNLPETVRRYSNVLLQKIGIKPRKLYNETGFDKNLDLENSKAIPLSQGLIYLTEKDQQLREQIKNDLKSLEIDGEKPVREVKEYREIYSGKMKNNAPDLIVKPSKGYMIRQSNSESDSLIEKINETDWEATNHEDGIFIAEGDSINPTDSLEIALKDVTGLLLDMYGIEPDQDIDSSSRKGFNTLLNS